MYVCTWRYRYPANLGTVKADQECIDVTDHDLTPHAYNRTHTTTHRQHDVAHTTTTCTSHRHVTNSHTHSTTKRTRTQRQQHNETDLHVAPHMHKRDEEKRLINRHDATKGTSNAPVPGTGTGTGMYACARRHRYPANLGMTPLRALQRNTATPLCSTSYMHDGKWNIAYNTRHIVSVM